MAEGGEEIDLVGWLVGLVILATSFSKRNFHEKLKRSANPDASKQAS